MIEGTMKARLLVTWALATTALVFFTWVAFVLMVVSPAREANLARQSFVLKSLMQQHAPTVAQDQGKALQTALISGDLGAWILLEAKLNGHTVSRVSKSDLGVVAEVEARLGLSPLGPKSTIRQVLVGGESIEAVGILQPELSPGLFLAYLFAAMALILAASVVTGLFVYADVKKALQGLSSLIEQAQALDRGELIIVESPPIKELNSLFGHFNQAAASIHQQVVKLKQDVTTIKSELDHDELTGATSRPVFVAALARAIEQDLPGHVVFIRIVGLMEMNATLGRNRADEFILGVAATIRTRLYTLGNAAPIFARMNGSEFGILLAGLSYEAVKEWGAKLATALKELHDTKLSESADVAYIGVTELIADDSASRAMSRADSAVTSAHFNRSEFVYLRPEMHYAHVSIADWRVILENSLNSGRIELAFFPVVDPVLNLVHNECALRLRAPNDEMLPAREFLPAAIRCHRILDLDLRAIELAVAHIKKTSETVAVNLAPQSISRPYFLTRLSELLESNVGVTARLCLEVSEVGLYNHIEELVALTESVGHLGVRVGIDHFATSFSSLPSLYTAKVDYIKLDAIYCDGASNDIGKQRFLQVVINIASSLGIAVIAQNVRNKADFDTLADMGVAALTGCYVSEHANLLRLDESGRSQI